MKPNPVRYRRNGSLKTKKPTSSPNCGSFTPKEPPLRNIIHWVHAEVAESPARVPRKPAVPITSHLRIGSTLCRYPSMLAESRGS